MDWEKISPSQFEELCCLYAKSNYREFTWQPTPRSWDGNKDGEFVVEIEPINQLFKGWYEAKYTKHFKKSIPHAHMDSTLVSGILDGHVVYILFITNGKITSNFKRRATTVLRPHRIEVNFVDGEILEDWLSQNFEVYSAFFGEENFKNSRPFFPKIVIEDVCFFDSMFSASMLLEPIRNLTVGNEYFLYIGIRSNTATNCSISLNTDRLRIFSEPARYVKKFIQAGYSSLLLKCQAYGPFNGKLQIRIETAPDVVSELWEQQNFVIHDDLYPRIVYQAQTKAIYQIYDYLRVDCSYNSILSVIGSEGSGKSYLHRKVLESLSKGQNECLSIQFSEKKAENACSFCKLILFLNFGTLYKLSAEAFSTLIEGNVNLPLGLFTKLREGADNQIVALHAIHEVIQLIKGKNDYALMPVYHAFMHRQVSYIFIDDVQKLDEDYSLLCKNLISEFESRKFSQIIIFGYRPKEFYNSDLEKMICENSQKEWTLGTLTQNDVKETFSFEFGETIGSLSELFPRPLNVLQLITLIKKLRLEKITQQDILQVSTSFTEAYRVVNSQNNRFAKQKIRSSQYQKEIYVIYKIESGISKEILCDFWGEQADTIFADLSNQNLVREINGEVIPFHDAYLYAFQQRHTFPPSCINELVRLLTHIWESGHTAPALESNIISILIAEGNLALPNLKDMAFRYCKEYYEVSQYYSAKMIAHALLPDIDSFNIEQLDENMLELLYIYAQSVKFTENHVQSTKLFQKLIKWTEKDVLKPELRDMARDALSEILNNEMWMLNYKGTQKYLNELRRYRISDDATIYAQNAYLNYLNRKMMCESFFEVHIRDESYTQAISESERFGRKDYVAYAKMDKARTLYATSPHQAYELLKEASLVFVGNKKFYRRSLECKSEIAFLETLLHGIGLTELYKLQKEMLTRGYINSYTKTALKILTIELANGTISPETATNRLNRLTLQNPEVFVTKRLSIAAYQLLSLAAFIEGNGPEVQKYCAKHSAVVRNMNDSYKCVPRHNLQVAPSFENVHWVGWAGVEEDSFWLDPRLW